MNSYILGEYWYWCKNVSPNTRRGSFYRLEIRLSHMIFFGRRCWLNILETCWCSSMDLASPRSVWKNCWLSVSRVLLFQLFCHQPQCKLTGLSIFFEPKGKFWLGLMVQSNRFGIRGLSWTYKASMKTLMALIIWLKSSTS